MWSAGWRREDETMVKRNSAGALTAEEKPIVKALLKKGWRNQDIQHLLNKGRVATINSARITEVKSDNAIKSAGENEVEFVQPHYVVPF